MTKNKTNDILKNNLVLIMHVHILLCIIRHLFNLVLFILSNGKFLKKLTYKLYVFKPGDLTPKKHTHIHKHTPYNFSVHFYPKHCRCAA